MLYLFIVLIIVLLFYLFSLSVKKSHLLKALRQINTIHEKVNMIMNDQLDSLVLFSKDRVQELSDEIYQSINNIGSLTLDEKEEAREAWENAVAAIYRKLETSNGTKQGTKRKEFEILVEFEKERFKRHRQDVLDLTDNLYKRSKLNILDALDSECTLQEFKIAVAQTMSNVIPK